LGIPWEESLIPPSYYRARVGPGMHPLPIRLVPPFRDNQEGLDDGPEAVRSMSPAISDSTALSTVPRGYAASFPPLLLCDPNTTSLTPTLGPPVACFRPLHNDAVSAVVEAQSASACLAGWLSVLSRRGGDGCFSQVGVGVVVVVGLHRQFNCLSRWVCSCVCLAAYESFCRMYLGFVNGALLHSLSGIRYQQ